MLPPGESQIMVFFVSRTQLHVLAGGSTPKSPLPLRVRNPHLTHCVIGPYECTCQMAPKSVKRFKQGARMWQTDDRPRYGEMCRNRRNRLRCKTRFRLIIIITKTVFLVLSLWHSHCESLLNSPLIIYECRNNADRRRPLDQAEELGPKGFSFSHRPLAFDITTECWRSFIFPTEGKKAFSRPAWLVLGWFIRLQMVTHPSTNRARRGTTTLTGPTRCQYAKRPRHCNDKKHSWCINVRCLTKHNRPVP